MNGTLAQCELSNETLRDVSGGASCSDGLVTLRLQTAMSNFIRAAALAAGVMQRSDNSSSSNIGKVG
jgi:hypothetical protein